MSKLNRLFSERDRAAVREATAAAESKTGAEVVSVVVARCDAYDEAAWKAAALGAVAAALAAALWFAIAGPWRLPGAVALALPAVAGTGLGYLAAVAWPAFTRALVAPEVLDLRVERRAAQAFQDEEIGATRGSTGVLVFLALFEHRVRIVADRGVAARVDAAAWRPIADDLARGMRQGRAAAALVEAVTACGELLAAAGVARTPDDVDELSDEVRLSDD